MGHCSVEYKEMRFVIEDDLTQVYVWVNAIGDCPHMLQGWHHKTFAKNKPVIEILNTMFTKDDDCLLWPLNAPPAAK